MTRRTNSKSSVSSVTGPYREADVSGLNPEHIGITERLNSQILVAETIDLRLASILFSPKSQR